MIILGLTGSIAMGKSKAAEVFLQKGVPVHDADAVVHRLLAKGGLAVPLVAEIFPQAISKGAVDRKALGAIVFADPLQLKRLEAILHPLVRQDEQRFLAAARRRRAKVALLNIPLFFETGGEKRCHATIVVTAPAFVQESRVLRRAGMTREKLDGVRRNQMPEQEKRKRADFIVQTGNGYHFSRAKLLKILEWARHA
jgi:dephospho-CoA kinase